MEHRETFTASLPNHGATRQTFISKNEKERKNGATTRDNDNVESLRREIVWPAREPSVNLLRDVDEIERQGAVTYQRRAAGCKRGSWGRSAARATRRGWLIALVTARLGSPRSFSLRALRSVLFHLARYRFSSSQMLLIVLEGRPPDPLGPLRWARLVAFRAWRRMLGQPTRVCPPRTTRSFFGPELTTLSVHVATSIIRCQRLLNASPAYCSVA